MKNVLIIDNSTYITGASKSIALFAAELSPKYNFYWAVPKTFAEDELRFIIGDQPVERFEFLELSKRPSSFVLYFPQLVFNTFKLRRVIRENNISIVHSNDCYNMCGILLKVLDRDVKLVYHVRLLPTSYIGKIYGTLMRVIKRKADAVVCCSRIVAESIGEMPGKKVIYDSDVFPETGIAKPKINPTVKNIIYVGNILPGKGQALALDAFALAREEFPDLMLRFVGKYDHNEVSTDFKKKLDQIIKEKSLEKNVVFEGLKYEIEKEIEKADLVLNLSESESFSMVCLEALKTGVPLITADSGGPAELFEHLKSGWLVKNRDTQAAAEAIKVLSRNQSLREQFSVEGKKYVAEKFNITVNARELDKLYTDLLNQA